MKKTIALFKKGFQTSCSKTPEFSAFARAFKKELTKELESIGATKIEFSIGHFYVSGFYTIGDQVWYFSISDVRYFREFKLLYRTATGYKDYTGGSNQYVNIEVGMSKKMNSPKFQII